MMFYHVISHKQLLINLIQASNVQLSMQSALITEAVLCALLAIIFENVHDLSTGCA